MKKRCANSFAFFTQSTLFLFCLAVIGCAPLELPEMYNVTECLDLGPGEKCLVGCNQGYLLDGFFKKPFSCPRDNTDIDTQPIGTPPGCLGN